MAASTSIVYSNGQLVVTVTLSDLFKQPAYLSCGISTYSVTDGSSYVSGEITRQYAPSSSSSYSSYSVTFYISAESYTVGTYIYGWAQSGNGSYWSAGYDVVPSAQWYVTYSYTGTPGSFSDSFDYGHIRCITFTPSSSGTVTWSSSGSYDTVGWITDHQISINTSTGNPINTSECLSYNDDYSGTNFSCSCDVLAGIEYYFYARLYGIYSSGSVTLTLQLSANTWYTTRRTLTYLSTPNTYSDTFSIDQYQILMYSITPNISGTLTWTSSGNGDTVGWINSSSSFQIDSNGHYPVQGYYIGSYDDDSAGGNQFSVSYNVTAGVTYWLFAKCYGPTNSASSVTLNVSIAESSGTVTININVGSYYAYIEINNNGSISQNWTNSVTISANVGSSISISYYGPTSYSYNWYPFYGWYSGSGGTGTLFSYSRTYSFTVQSGQSTINIYGHTGHITSAIAWIYPKTQGGAFNLTAEEWNRLWLYIEARRNYSIAHTRAVQGDVFTAAEYNEVTGEIGGSTVSAGDIVTAALMNALITSANNMQ